MKRFTYIIYCESITLLRDQIMLRLYQFAVRSFSLMCLVAFPSRQTGTGIAHFVVRANGSGGSDAPECRIGVLDTVPRIFTALEYAKGVFGLEVDTDSDLMFPGMIHGADFRKPR